jgi:hypothetical protein
MKSKPNKNNHGLKLEYNPNDSADLKLAVEIARYWHKRGAGENRLVAITDNSKIHLQKAA